MYDRSLEAYIGLNSTNHELSHEELQQRLNKNYTIQVGFPCSILFFLALNPL